MRKIIALILIQFFFISTVLANSPGENVDVSGSELDLTLFYSKTCPHCHEEIEFLTKLEKKYPDLKMGYFEVSENEENLLMLVEYQKELNIVSNGVPLTVIGNEYIVGFQSDSVTGLEIVNKLKRNGYDFGENIDSGGVIVSDDGNENIVSVPFFGEIDYRTVSLPLLTVVLGGLDGFNPCAMWVLVFLISLLIGVKDKRKMWILGGVFIFSSAVVYFLFMTAWLNLFLFLGYIVWIRIIIAAVALGTGIYYLFDYVQNPEGACNVAGGEKKQKILNRLKELVLERGFLMSFFGIIALAAAVNMVELVCSAGLPAVFTRVLTLSELSLWQYYAYIFLYVFVFMLDDLIVFVIAMVTFKSINASGKYSRISRLVGGMLMLILGILLAFKPEWLMF
ncbi:cytochrome c biogenesis protein [Patescibacteria group bacterium]